MRQRDYCNIFPDYILGDNGYFLKDQNGSDYGHLRSLFCESVP